MKRYFFLFFFMLSVIILTFISCASDVTQQSPQQFPQHSQESAPYESESASAGVTYIGDLYLIDTHSHILPKDRELNDAFLASLIATAKKVGVSKIALGLHARHVPDRPPTYSEDHDVWILAVAEKYPDIIIPMLGGFDPADPNAVSYVEEQLKTGKWKGIGELDLRNSVKKTTTPINDPTMMEIYKLAATYDIPVMVHYSFCYKTDCNSGKAEYENALKENPKTKFISAHGCLPDFMKKYENLYCEYEITMSMLPSTKLLDRVMIGTDVQHPDLTGPGISIQEPMEYEDIITTLRERLETLDTADAERIAHRTAEEIFHSQAAFYQVNFF